MILVGFFFSFDDQFGPLARQGFASSHQYDDGPNIGRFPELGYGAQLAGMVNEGIPRIVVYVIPYLLGRRKRCYRQL